MKYHLFAYDLFDRVGGYHAYVGSFESIEECKDFFKRLMMEKVDIDLSTITSIKVEKSDVLRWYDGFVCHIVLDHKIILYGSLKIINPDEFYEIIWEIE